MMLDYTTRPLSDRTWLRLDRDRKKSQFTASWSDTLTLLGHEIRMLNGRNVIIGADLAESDLRIDGRIRANARTATPAVEVAFDSKHGPLIYRCDLYTAAPYYRRNAGEPWHHNVRSIAKTLEALRAVDRYAATAKGEQYRGYRAIESGDGGATHMDRYQAEQIIQTLAGVGDHAVLDAVVFRRAKATAHPDVNNGDRTRWDLLEQAIDVINA